MLRGNARKTRLSAGPISMSNENTPRLLVVDDVEENREILRRRFSRLGYHVTEAEDGEGALAKIAAELGPIDIVVNNAGITRDGTMHKMTPEMWAEVVLERIVGGAGRRGEPESDRGQE